MGLEIGQRVGKYEILALLGAGGMGQVYGAASAIPLLPHFFEAKAGQKSAALVTEGPAQSPSSGGGIAGAPSPPPAGTSAPAPPPKDSAITNAKAAPSRQLYSKTGRSSIERLRSKHQAQRVGSRGDITSSLNRMNAYTREANRSLKEGDVESATAERERYEKELSTLETFLGR